MAFSQKKPGKGLQRKTGLNNKTPLGSGKGLQAKPRDPSESPAADARKALQKRTLRALERARKAAAEAGVDLSEWEAEFIDSVSARVKTYGRAFADPDKGAMNGTLSLLQGVKLREIRDKVKKKGRPADPETEPETTPE